jgi:hypothetical protein
MPRIHQDFTAQTIKWVVRGTKLDGTRWESGHKHATREAAESEISEWGPEMGTMKIMKKVIISCHPPQVVNYPASK